MRRTNVNRIIRTWEAAEERKPPELKAKDLALEAADAKRRLLQFPNEPEYERELAGKIQNSENPGLAAKGLLLAKRRNEQMAVKDHRARSILATAIDHDTAVEMLLGNMVETELTEVLSKRANPKGAQTVLSAHSHSSLNLTKEAIFELKFVIDCGKESEQMWQMYDEEYGKGVKT